MSGKRSHVSWGIPRTQAGEDFSLRLGEAERAARGAADVPPFHRARVGEELPLA